MKAFLLFLLMVIPLWAFAQKKIPMAGAPVSMSAEDAALKHKFRGIDGGELRIDAMFETARTVIINADVGLGFNMGFGFFSPLGDKTSSYGGSSDGDRLPMPKHLRMVRHPEDARYLGEDKFIPQYEGTPIIDVTVPVAQRIPESALEDLRKHGGSLRLKLRIHRDTLLVGWDIDRAYDPKEKDPFRPPVGPRYSSIGGDFREAIIFNGKVVETGWYIDPKTKKRIETNY